MGRSRGSTTLAPAVAYRNSPAPWSSFVIFFTATSTSDGLARPGADELAASEQEHDDLRLLDPADEPRELLGFVLDPVESQGHGDRVQVDFALEVRARYDVLDLDLRLHRDLLSALADLTGDGVDRFLDLVQALRAGADDLPGAEEEDRRLRLLEAVDEARELLRFGTPRRPVRARSIATRAGPRATSMPRRSRCGS